MESSTPAAVIAGRDDRQPPRSRRHRSRRTVANYAYLVPAVAVVVAVVYYGVGYTLWLSGHEWDGFAPDKVFVGGANYLEALRDPVVWRALRNTVAMFVLLIPAQLLVGLLAAALLQSRLPLGNLFRVIFFLPVVIAPAVMAPIFRDIFSSDGAFNEALGLLGMQELARPWLVDADSAIVVLAFFTFWHSTGFAVVLYGAALTQIDPSVFEASQLDGAGPVRTFAALVIPLVHPTTMTLVIIGVIGVLKTFDAPYLITAGGPNNGTQFLSTYIYQEGLTNFHVGYASAVSIILLVLSLGFAAWQSQNQRRTARQA